MASSSAERGHYIFFPETKDATKPYLAIIGFLKVPVFATAVELSGLQSYYGTIQVVALGSFGHTGVKISKEALCRGRR